MGLSHHIIGDGSQLQKRISEVAQDVLRMGALVEESFRYSYQALIHGELEALETITVREQEIDRYYKHIEMKCASILTLQSPVAQDLRILSAFMQLVRDLERIGDYAQDLGEIAFKLALYPPHPCMPEVATMSKQAQIMLAQAIVALTELDSEAAERIKHLDDTVDYAYEKLYKTLAYQKDIKGFAEPIILLSLAIRHLERMADHATNIAKRVAYIVTGERN